jgi:hypothetical protein
MIVITRGESILTLWFFIFDFCFAYNGLQLPEGGDLTANGLRSTKNRLLGGTVLGWFCKKCLIVFSIISTPAICDCICEPNSKDYSN